MLELQQLACFFFRLAFGRHRVGGDHEHAAQQRADENQQTVKRPVECCDAFRMRRFAYPQSFSGVGLDAFECPANVIQFTFAAAGSFQHFGHFIFLRIADRKCFHPVPDHSFQCVDTSALSGIILNELF